MIAQVSSAECSAAITGREALWKAYLDARRETDKAAAAKVAADQTWSEARDRERAAQEAYRVWPALHQIEEGLERGNGAQGEPGTGSE